MSAEDEAIGQLAVGLSGMLDAAGAPLPGTPLGIAVDPSVNPLAAAKALSDFVQQYMECDLETATALLDRMAEALEMAVSISALTGPTDTPT